MKKGFTMIELIFVIVILGILAAVAIPKLAATRDDAKAASIKTDIGTMMNAVPAWFQGQKEADLQNAASIDTNTWVLDSGNCRATYTDAATDTVIVGLYDGNGTLLTSCPENNATILKGGGTGVAELRIDLNASNAGDIVDVLINSMGVNNVVIQLAGKKVQW